MHRPRRRTSANLELGRLALADGGDLPRSAAAPRFRHVRQRGIANSTRLSPVRFLQCVRPGAAGVVGAGGNFLHLSKAWCKAPNQKETLLDVRSTDKYTE